MLQNKRCLITGANAGIGFATALQLARMGAELVIVCRDQAKSDEAKRQLIEQSGQPKITALAADLSNFASIRQLSDALHQQFDRLDILINNAGGVFSTFELTADGLERTIALNHFNYFLLTYHCLGLLQAAPSARIVNVASEGNFRGEINLDSFTQNKGFSTLVAYRQSKLANVLFTYELAERLRGTTITCNCLHPGVVDTQIGNKRQSWFISLGWNVMKWWSSSITPTEGAATSVYLASNADVQDISGKYFDTCRAIEPNPVAHDVALRKLLWQFSEEKAGIRYAL